ncbi:putative reverse transcriptase domain-containing protein [Tanacetum coccineum]
MYTMSDLSMMHEIHIIPLRPNLGVLAIVTNPVRKEYTGHFARDCRAGPRMVTSLNARNLTTTRGACFECGGTDHYKAGCPRNNGNQARGGPFMMGAEEARQDPNIVTVRNFPEVFLDDLSRLPPSQEFKFCIDLIPGAMPVVKSPYRLAPFKMEELSIQLREL